MFNLDVIFDRAAKGASGFIFKFTAAQYRKRPRRLFNVLDCKEIIYIWYEER